VCVNVQGGRKRKGAEFRNVMRALPLRFCTVRIPRKPFFCLSGVLFVCLFFLDRKKNTAEKTRMKRAGRRWERRDE